MVVHVVTVLSPTDPDLLMTKVFNDLDTAKEYVVEVAQSLYGQAFESFNSFITWYASCTESEAEEGQIVLLEDIPFIITEK